MADITPDNSIGSIFDNIDNAKPDDNSNNIPLTENIFSQVEITVPEDDSPVNASMPQSQTAFSNAIPKTEETGKDWNEPEPLSENKDEKKEEENNNGEQQNKDNNEAFTTENTAQEEVKPFDEKAAAKDIMNGVNPGSKPPVLNKTLILSIGTGVFIFVIVFALFIFPLITKKRELAKNAKPQAQEVSGNDYQAMAYKTEPSDYKENAVNNNQNQSERKLNEDGLPEIKIDDKYTYKEEEKTKSTSTSNQVMGSTSAVKVRPDTSEDSMQMKTINGIKGLTSTQRNYLTPDYSNYSSYDARTASLSGSGTDVSNPYAQYGLPADKNEYLNTLLQSYGQQNSGSEDSYSRQNDQSGKNQFYQNGKGQVSGEWLALNTIWQGTIFEATLTSNINTDLPGECTAVITKNIYSSQDGSFLLIPQNSKLLGSYNSSISYSQSRVQVGWHTLIRPDGYQISLGNMNATDTKGASGLKGIINDHPFQFLKAIALMSAFNIISSEFEAVGLDTDNQYVQNIMANSMEVTNTLGSKLIDRALDVQPTITIKAGTKINIVANSNLTLPVLEPYPVTEPYHKPN